MAARNRVCFTFANSTRQLIDSESTRRGIPRSRLVEDVINEHLGDGERMTRVKHLARRVAALMVSDDLD